MEEVNRNCFNAFFLVKRRYIMSVNKMGCLFCFWWCKRNWIFLKLLKISHWNPIFWVLCPQVRDKKFSCTKANGMFVTNVSLKSQLVYRGRSVHKIYFAGRLFCICIGLVFITNKSADEEASSFSFRQVGGESEWKVFVLCRHGFILAIDIISCVSYCRSLIAIFRTLYIVLQLSLCHFMFIYLLYTQ